MRILSILFFLASISHAEIPKQELSTPTIHDDTTEEDLNVIDHAPKRIEKVRFGLNLIGLLGAIAAFRAMDQKIDLLSQKATTLRNNYEDSLRNLRTEQETFKRERQQFESQVQRLETEMEGFEDNLEEELKKAVQPTVDELHNKLKALVRT